MKIQNRPNYLLKHLVLLVLAFAVAGCNQFLDESPDNRVELDTIDKAAQLLVSAYSSASPNFTDWMSDDVQYTAGTTKLINQQQIYRWEDVTTGPQSQDTPLFFWVQTYAAIAPANEVLAVIDNLPAETEEETVKKRAIEGEALLARAYGHFMLVNMFAKHYDRETSDADLGIPYVKQPEDVFLKQYKRLTVKRVYDEIEDDLLRGLDRIDDSFFQNSGKYHFNKNAALAFASRFYLFKDDYVKCVQYSNRLLGSNPGSFVRNLNSAEFQQARSSLTGYAQLYTSPDQSANLLLMKKYSLVQLPSYAYGPSSNLYRQLFAINPFPGAVDQRMDPALRRGAFSVYPVRYQSLFQRSGLNSGIGFPYYIHMAFTGEEVLLNRAESYARLANFTAAINDLKVLAERRYRGGAIDLNQQTILTFVRTRISPIADDVRFALLLYIIESERRKEFMMQGMRWWDIKRFGFTITHNLPDEEPITLEGEDPRKVFQIPASAIDVAGLKPNPR